MGDHAAQMVFADSKGLPFQPSVNVHLLLHKRPTPDGHGGEVCQ